MTVKTSGAEFKRFYNDHAFWPDGAWHEGEEIEVDGYPLSEDDVIGEVADSAAMKITGGVILGLPNGNEPSLEGFFKKWRKEQNAVSLVVECGKDKEAAVRAAVRAAGGRIA